MDFKADVVLMGHDGPGACRHRPGQNQGAAPESLSRQGGAGRFGRDVVRHGPVTLLSVVEKEGGKLGLLMAQGESVGRDRFWRSATRTAATVFPAVPARSWSTGTSRGRRTFAVGVGHLAGALRKAGALWGVDVRTQVC